jgi:hypothetical protein
MAVQRATYTGVQPILSAFHDIYVDKPGAYSIWNGRDIIDQYRGNDLTIGEDNFEAIITRLGENENAELLNLKFHPALKEDWITAKTPVIASMFIRVTPLAEYQPFRGGDLEGRRVNQMVAYQPNNELKDAIAGINQRLDDLTAETNQEPEPDPIEKYLKYLEHPAVGSIVNTLVNALMPLLLKISPQTQNFSPGIAGINSPVMEQTNVVELTEEQNDLIDNALRILSHHCDVVVSLDKLAKIATNNPVMFKGFIQMLNNF